MIRERHSVRSYLNIPIPEETLDLLQAEIERINEESGLHIQLMTNADKVFDKLSSHFLGWGYVPCYLAVVGPDTPELEETCGWYGEHLVLFLQSLGLNSCWAGMFRRSAVKAKVGSDEKLVITIAFGFGVSKGKARKSKEPEDVTDLAELPAWFRAGLEAAMLAPTAINQQKFFFTLDGDRPIASVSGKGPFVDLDLGIVKYHFAAVTGKKPD